ncbi:M16 family metallopeptidase [Sagittula sp. SSi028]|uniref:M16 family metallopeptidase n=1 Tax=Sagittula sp. SSi028 TaxID=3400636 RepID=UPI003AF900CB
MKRFVLALGLMLGATVAHAEIDIQEVQSPKGFKAWLVEDHAIPFVALELRFKGGASLDEVGKRGASNLMIGLLEEGAGDLDARGFAEQSEAIAAQFGYSISDDAVQISAKYLTEKKDESIALLRASLNDPTFDQASVDRVRQQILTSLRSDKTDPDQIARNAFSAQVFGDHPYGSDYAGTVDSVQALTRDDVVTAWRNALAQDRAYVAAAGDITAEELGEVMDLLLSDLPETGAPLPERVEVETTARVTVLPFETPQSVALFGHRGLPRDHPDFFAAYVMNTIFGEGGFESRLMTEVREKRGLTYGVYSYLLPKDHAELLIGQVASANDRISEAVDVIRDEWAKLAENGVTQAELTQAQTYLTGAYALRFDGNGPIAKILVGMQMDGLTPQYINTRNDRINAVTLEDIKRVAAEIIKPDELTFVVVGDPKGLDGGIIH